MSQATLDNGFGHAGTPSLGPARRGGTGFANDPEARLAAESFRDRGRDGHCAPANPCNKRFCWKPGDLLEGYDHKYTYSRLGDNRKITDMQAACALAQMDRVEDFIAARKADFASLKERLLGVAEFLQVPEATSDSEPDEPDLWRGVWPGLATQQPDYVVDKLEEFLGPDFCPEPVSPRRRKARRHPHSSPPTS